MAKGGWQEFIQTLGTKLASSDGLLNKNKDENLLNDKKPVSLMYPNDLFAHSHQAFVFFNVRDSKKTVTPTYGSICLYMPSSLKVGYSANWTDAKLPLQKLMSVGNELVNLGKDAYTEISKGIESGDAGGAFMGTMKKLGNNSAAQFFAHNYVAKELSANYAAELRNYLGKTFNPFAAIVYDHPEFRVINLEFEFFAKNAKESEEIRKIIKMFKLAMHPSIEGGRPANFNNYNGAQEPLTWLFPYTFDIFFCTPYTDKMFMLKRTALLTADVDYAASPVQAFFKDGSPVHIKLNLTFKEMEYLTREDIEDNY